ncbi:MAG: GNAT family N-acetyltransferase [Bacillota bacterium]|nr:GNAT family N-acetyltransferase [Bacillota bacterium]
MIEIRLANKGEIIRQKEIWRASFGDNERYIDFYYANRYREEETLLLLQDERIAAMLTMLPVKIFVSDLRSYNSTMLYAIATDPNYQLQGFATRLLEYAHHYLQGKNNIFTLLVPTTKQLFDFYGKQGYQNGFYIREALLTHEKIQSFQITETCRCSISGISPQEYIKRREKQLKGKLFVSYNEEDILYQKKLSMQSNADIFGIDFKKAEGCAIIERMMNTNKAVIKELLVPEELTLLAMKHLAQLLQAKEYLIRTPAYLGQRLDGSVHPFGMIKATHETDLVTIPEDLGYLGIAFD